MTLFVPVLILAVLVLAGIAWLAFGPRSSPIVPSFFSHPVTRDPADRDFQAVDVDSASKRPTAQETEHVRNRLHASNGSAASLTGNAQHLELRPVLHTYNSAQAQAPEIFRG